MKIKVGLGFPVEKAEIKGQYYLLKPGVLCNLITRETTERMVGPLKTRVLMAINRLEEA